MTSPRKFHFVKTKLTFAKEPRPTGLWAVGHPLPSTNIKIDGKVVGAIIPPSWQTKNVWKIGFMVEKQIQDDNPNCSWKWVYFKKEFETEPEAREFIKQNINQILDHYELHPED